MITMINEKNGYETQFKNYKRLYSKLNSHQWTKRFSKPQNLIEDWFFACHSYRRVMALYAFIANQRREYRANPEKKKQKFDVLEISYGRYMEPIIMSITPELNVESLLEEWCKTYCKSHGYKLVEVQDDDSILPVKKSQNTHSNDEDGS